MDSMEQRKQQAQQQQREKEQAEASKMRRCTPMAPLVFPPRSADSRSFPMRIPSLTPRLPRLSSGCNGCNGSKEDAAAAQLEAEMTQSALRSVQDEMCSLAHQLQEQQQQHTEERDQAAIYLQQREQIHSAFIEATVEHACAALEERQQQRQQQFDQQHEAQLKHQEERAQRLVEELQRAFNQQLDQTRVEDEKREERCRSCEERLHTAETKSSELQAALQSCITLEQLHAHDQSNAIRADFKAQLESQQQSFEQHLQQVEARHQERITQLQTNLDAPNEHTAELQTTLAEHDTSLSKLSDLKRELCVLEGQILTIKEEIANARKKQQAAEALSQRATAAAAQLQAHAQPAVNLYPAAGAASPAADLAPDSVQAHSSQLKSLPRDAAPPVTSKDFASLMVAITLEPPSMPSAVLNEAHSAEPSHATAVPAQSAESEAAANLMQVTGAADADGLVAVTSLSADAKTTEINAAEADLQAVAHQSDEEVDSTPARRMTPAASAFHSRNKRKEPSETSAASADDLDEEWTLTGHRARRQSKPRTINNQQRAPKRARGGSTKKQEAVRSKRKQAAAAAASPDEADSESEANEANPPLHSTQAADPPAVNPPSANSTPVPLQEPDGLIDLRSPSPVPQDKRAMTTGQQQPQQNSSAKTKPTAAHPPAGHPPSMFGSAPDADPFDFVPVASSSQGASQRSSAVHGSSANKPSLLLHLSQSQRSSTPRSSTPTSTHKKARGASPSIPRRSPIPVPKQRQQPRARKGEPLTDRESPPHPPASVPRKRLFGSPDEAEDKPLSPPLQLRDTTAALSQPHLAQVHHEARQQEDAEDDMSPPLPSLARKSPRPSSVARPVHAASRKRVSAANPNAARSSAISRSLTQPPEDITDDPFANNSD